MSEQLRLAFYRGEGNLADRVIRWVTRSEFSHVELVREGVDLPNGIHRTAAISSSPRDGGVRVKLIDFKPENWEFVEINAWAPLNMWSRAAVHLGDGYDYAGILFSQALSIRRHAPDRWFCSELLGYAAGLPSPQTMAPGDFMDQVKLLNQVWHLAGIEEAS